MKTTEANLIDIVIGLLLFFAIALLGYSMKDNDSNDLEAYQTDSIVEYHISEGREIRVFE